MRIRRRWHDALALIDAIRAQLVACRCWSAARCSISGLRHGMAPLPAASADVRARSTDAAGAWLAALHAELARLDPPAAARIHATDSQRIQRASRSSSSGSSALRSFTPRPTRAGAGARLSALVPFERDALYQRIDARFEAMIAAGSSTRCARSVPRRPVAGPAQHALGRLPAGLEPPGWSMRPRAGDRGRSRATRNLAKRQLTWLKGERDLVWIRSLPIRTCRNFRSH
jgi:tRNA dimethylallyltransferase